MHWLPVCRTGGWSFTYYCPVQEAMPTAGAAATTCEEDALVGAISRPRHDQTLPYHSKEEPGDPFGKSQY